MCADRDPPKLEPVADWVDLPEEEERSWDMRETLETEMPYNAPPGWYEAQYDQVLRIPYDSDGELRARLAFTLQCKREQLTPVGDVFTTAKWFCLRVRK